MLRKEKRSYLYKLSNNYNNNINKISKYNKIKNYYINEYNNKGIKIQRINKINNWENQIYNYDKKEEINKWIIDRLVSRLIIKIFKLKINNINKDIYINKPKFKHTLNKVYIRFNYILGNINKIEKDNKKEYYTSIITDINNILLNNNNNNNKLISYLSKLYNKEIIIEGNNLKYHYNDNIILNKTIINNIEKYKGGLSGKYSKILRMNIPINNNLLIINKYISNLINNNYIKYNNINNNNYSQYNLNIKEIYNLININNINKNLLINKYLIGLNILYKGKNLYSAGVSRSIKDKLLLGSLSNKLYNKYTNYIPNLINNKGINLNINLNKSYKLNYIPHHHNIITYSKNNKIKTGTFGITTKLNTI